MRRWREGRWGEGRWRWRKSVQFPLKWWLHSDILTVEEMILATW